MDQLVNLLMEEEKREPSQQFVRILQSLDPTEVGLFLNWFNFKIRPTDKGGKSVAF